MPDCWYCIPTANPAQCAETFAAWKDMGYKTAALVDGEMMSVVNADITVRIPAWHGYPHAVNLLCSTLLKRFPDIQVLATGGDDIAPEPNRRADDIAEEFVWHFPDLMGVLQPTGDPFMSDEHGTPAAARICGSPWMGRAFIERINGGRGPFWPGYFHMFCDEEMQAVTQHLGILWQRPDLSQPHNHWSRLGKPRPVYLNKAEQMWPADKALFDSRKAAGFPGHEPLEAYAHAASSH